MAIDYSEERAVLKSVVTIQEVDDLQEWLIAHPQGEIDLEGCEHMHTAALQTLTSARRTINAWPSDTSLRGWIEPLLAKQEAQ